MLAGIDDETTADCSYCQKSKPGDVVLVQFGQEQGFVAFCWGCLKKQTKWRARQSRNGAERTVANLVK
jgi:hypothetical protein